MRGAGYGMGTPLVTFNPKVDTDFSIKMPVNQGFSDCDIPSRPGQLFNQPNPPLAQVAMVGGRRGCGCSVPRGGARHTRKQRGGRYAIDPNVNVGGDGPNAGAVVAAVPCDARAGSPNPYNPVSPPDVRAPVQFYSATGNMVQKGGAHFAPADYQNHKAGDSYSTSNPWTPECNKAPGSMLPVYEATTAGFHFAPSTERGGALPDGVTAYNDVIPHGARTGGARKASRKTNRKRRASRRSSGRVSRRR